MPYPKQFITIDPGVAFGYSLFQKGRLMDFGYHVPSQRLNWLDRVHDSCLKLDQFIRGSTSYGLGVITKGYCEMPGLFQSSGGDVTAKSGALVKLAFTTGALCQKAYSLGVEIDLIEVNTWKGQMDKLLVIRRIKETMNDMEQSWEGISSHAWDAVGIGLFVMGKF